MRLRSVFSLAECVTLLCRNIVQSRDGCGRKSPYFINTAQEKWSQGGQSYSPRPHGNVERVLDLALALCRVPQTCSPCPASASPSFPASSLYYWHLGIKNVTQSFGLSS